MTTDRIHSRRENRTAKQVSIIIVTYNSEKDIFDCVASIDKYADIPKEDIELIVVDNCSREPKAMFDRLKEQWGEEIILLENTTNGGYGQGNNVGIRCATAPVILIMNPDVRLMEPILKTAVEAFKSDERISMLGMKQMLTRERTSKNSFCCTYMMNGYLHTILTSICNRFDWYLPSIMYFSGSCFFVRKSMFEEIGLFDESNFMYGEEDDIHYRMRERFGKSMKYMPHLHYIHPTHTRRPSIDYEKKKIEATVRLNRKKSYSSWKTIRNRLRNANILILQERIKKALGKTDAARMKVLQELREYLKEDQNPKVCYVDPQSYGNLSIYDYNLLSNLHTDILYICSRKYDHKPLPYHIHTVPLYNYSHISRRWLQALSYLSSSIRLFCKLLVERPEVIHVQWLKLPSLEYTLYKAIRRIIHARLVYTAHNILPHDSGARYLKTYRKWYKLVDAIIVHTEDTKCQLTTRFRIDGNAISVIPHGLLKIEADEEEVARESQSLEEQYDLKNKFVISSLGYQNIYKGVDLIAEAWSKSPELTGNKDCCLLLFGKNRGVDLTALRGVENAIIQDRYVSNEEFLALMRRSDVTLMAYRQISQSGALLTALAERTPVLVSKTGGLTDPLQIAKIGWTVSELTAEAVRTSLLYLVSHKEEVQSVKQDTQAWEKLAQEYAWSKISEMTLRTYNLTDLHT